MTDRSKTNVRPEAPDAEAAALIRYVNGLVHPDLDAARRAGISFLATVAPLSESAAIERGLPADLWQRLQRLGFTRDELAAVIGNSSKTIQRKEDRSEPLDVVEGDRTMRLLRMTIQAIEALGDTGRALRWMRQANTALSGKTPLEALTTEPGTALVRRALGVIAFGGVA